jgi:hypothetical protein
VSGLKKRSVDEGKSYEVLLDMFTSDIDTPKALLSILFDR